jgi:hypothetical protein
LPSHAPFGAITVVARTVESNSSADALRYAPVPPARWSIGKSHEDVVTAMRAAPAASGPSRRVPAHAVVAQSGKNSGKRDWRTPPASARPAADVTTARPRPQRAGHASIPIIEASAASTA